jgi:hypothetical protein
MGQSYRIRTQLGINKSINIQLDQEFEFLEILSLKLQQEDVYTKSCAQYGVVVGRVTANNGFGLPNARVSIFIPIESVDESNPIVSSIYPYKSPNDKNEDGYRYNLLPYEQSYSSHAATGTLPTRLDALTGSTAIEIYDKYYKFSVKTNESGDYMIMGVPQGQHTLVMDVDLSDIGEFSLTPQDLIRMGLATEAQVAGNRFRSSNDLNSLPQIINIVKDLEVSPLWGDPELCDIAVNRVDFDLRDDANVDIQPTAVFMGSIYSTADSFRVRKNAKPKDDMGNLCALTTGPGQIVAIRQTIYQDSDGNPVLEKYQLEQSGNIIDGNGVWLTELPMNLDYYITNEFGEKTLSNDPTVGIPTKAKYRFKIKWQQPPTLTEQVRRAYYLVPNVKEYGWSSTESDPNSYFPPHPAPQPIPTNSTKKLASSYYFGLNWSGYTNGFTTTEKINRVNEIIDCEDTFYEFQYNRVYTVSGLIDEFKNGGRGRFIGVKEIDSQDCESSVNKFPVNDGFRNFDLLYFIFAILFQVIQIIGVPLLIVYHFVAFLWNNFAVPILIYFIASFALNAYYEFALATAMIVAATGSFGATLAAVAPFLGKGLLWTALTALLIALAIKIKNYKFGRMKLPMITYPDCQACDCDPEITSPGGDAASETPPSPGLLSQLSNSVLYSEAIQNGYLNSGFNDSDSQQNGVMISQSIGGFGSNNKNPIKFKIPQSGLYTMTDGNKFSSYATTLPPGERINIYNNRKKYFDNINKIKVTFNYPSNGGYTVPQFHYDNTLTVLATQELEVGALLTFVNPAKSTDKNYLWTGQTTVGGATLTGINGVVKNDAFVARTYYATTQITDTYTDYNIPSGTSECFLSLTLKITTSGTVIYSDCVGVSYTTTATTIGPFVISNENGVYIKSINGTAEYSAVTKGQSCKRYIYPSDIEYYQVLTAITITTSVVGGVTYYSLPNLGTGPSFWAELNSLNCIQILQERGAGWNYGNNTTIPPTPSCYDTSIFTDFAEQKVLILQRGVDPYSPKLPNRYGIGKIMGWSNEDAVVITGMTRMNIPIQKLPSGSTTSVQKHNNQNNIYSSSQFYSPGIPNSTLFPTASTTPGLQFSSYTTSNVGYYGALDSSWVGVPSGPPKVVANTKSYYAQAGWSFGSFSSTYGINNFSVATGVNGVRSLSTNKYWSSTTNISGAYDNAEDLSGGAYMFRGPFQYYRYNKFYLEDDSPFNLYFSPILYPYMTGTTQLSITNSSKVIMRTDRLPSSDFIDNGGVLNGSVSLLQQNLGFAVYPIEGDLSTFVSPTFSTGASQITPDIADQLAAENVLKTMSTCENMVGLNCYSGNNVNFGVKIGCQASDSVENGCYVMMNNPLIDLGKDLSTFGEWGYRFRFFYGLCRGVLSQSFTNNWVNGSLFTFPIQVNTYFDTNNEPTYPEFAKELIFYDKDSSNFYYRSSPYFLTLSSGTTRFIGRPLTTQKNLPLVDPVNSRNLLFPTTIVNLGIKDDFYQEIIFDASAKGYIMKSLQPTSYSDTSDLVNLFVISRITSNGFLSNVLSGLNGSLNKLFSRPQLRIDGDLAQTMSINSEYGVIPFSPEYYSVYGVTTDPVVILGSLDNPTMGIFFSSTTVDLQNKDFLTPGVIDFRPSNNANAITYQYGIKSQYTPFYQWELKQNSPTSIFGSEKNNWLTTQNSNKNNSGIFKYKYQSLTRRNLGTPSYFIGPNTALGDIYERGYIFNVDSSGNYSYSASPYSNKFLVSAPYHFYFGVVKGETALDKFKTKYSIDE